MIRKRVGEVLHERGKLSFAQIQALLQEQHKTPARFGELVLEHSWADTLSVAQALECVSPMKYIDCASTPCEKKALDCVPYEVAERLMVLPVRLEASQIVMAMAEPQLVSTVDELRFLTGRNISPRLAFRPEIIPAIHHSYGDSRHELIAPMEPEAESDAALVEACSLDLADEIEFISASSRQDNREAFQEMAAELIYKKTPAVRLAGTIVAEAIRRHALDLHIEPQAKEAAILLQAGGTSSELEKIPKKLEQALVTRIKILSDMDASERRAPQEGGFMAKLGDQCAKVRVSTLPNPYGERVQMHFMNSGTALMYPQPRGFSRNLAEQVCQLLSAPQGMLLVTGPTGPGRNVSFYSLLHLLRKPVKNARIWRGSRNVALLVHYFAEASA